MPTLFLMRHGEDDREKLTERGRLQARYTAMRIMEVVPYEQDLLILSSETPRARETTQILAKMFQDEGRRVTMRAEKDDANEKIPDVLSTLNKESVVIVVGQEPEIKKATAEVACEESILLQSGQASMLQYSECSWQKITNAKSDAAISLLCCLPG